MLHTGAGLSTSAGISDFRGPGGVWTLEKKGATRQAGVSFEDAVPTLAHMAIARLVEDGFVNAVVSQNVDNLHLKSGMPRDCLSELHGNLFRRFCSECKRVYAGHTQTRTVGLRLTGEICVACGGGLADMALDWDDVLPEPDYANARKWAREAELNVVVGTSCQMEPARGLPFLGGGKGGAVIVNLSETCMDERFGMRVGGECDLVFACVLMFLKVDVTDYVCEVKFWLCVENEEEGDGVCVWIEGANGGRAEIDIGHGWMHVQRGAKTTCIPPDTIRARVSIGESRGFAHARAGERVQGHVQVRAEYTERARALTEELKMRVEKERRGLGGEGWFVCGRKRGWGVCLFCGREVWCAKRGRRVHEERCLEVWRRAENTV